MTARIINARWAPQSQSGWVSASMGWAVIFGQHEGRGVVCGQMAQLQAFLRPAARQRGSGGKPPRACPHSLGHKDTLFLHLYPCQQPCVAVGVCGFPYSASLYGQTAPSVPVK